MDALFRVELKIKVEEVNRCLLNSELLCSLLRFRLLSVKDLQVVFGIALNTKTVILGLIECLIRRHVITVKHPTVLHHFNVCPLGQVCCASLRPLIHKVHLDCRLAAMVAHNKGRVNWVKIGRNGLEVR